MKRRLLWTGIDALIAGLILLIVWIIFYCLPQTGSPVSSRTDILTAARTDSPSSNQRDAPAADWHKRFAEHFTDTVVETEHSYTSPNLSVEITHRRYDTGIPDRSADGKHLKYGTSVSYTLADIYIGDISQLRTLFAQDTYGTIIRNGRMYRNQPSDAEMCILNTDGTMEICPPGTADAAQLTRQGAYQSWIFGPSLLDQNGKAKTEFITWDYIRQSHPRTAIGYFEPGHYCLLLADGRQKDSRGMFLDELAKVFQDLGCQAAYNLDGGHSSFMTFKDQVISHPYKSEQKVSDGIFICDQEETL